jgi:hypothetical protein
MSQAGAATSGGGGGGAVSSVTGNTGVTASPTTGAVVVSGVLATTSTVGVASFLNTDFAVSGGGQVSLLNPGGSGASLTWSIITTSQTAVKGHGYIIESPGAMVLTLPATSAVGDSFGLVISSYNFPTNLPTIAQAANQYVRVGQYTTTVGVGGTTKPANADATDYGDCLIFVCIEANKGWLAINVIGNWSLV